MVSQIAAVFVLAIAFLAAGIDSYAATLVVTKTADTADGICDADCSLREAVAAAASGDTVVFSPLFNSPHTITLTLGQIAITKNLTITGSGRDLLTVSGNNASRIFQVSGGVSVIMNSMKLTNGKASNAGGVGVVGSSLDLRNVIINNNHANDPGFGSGGGILINVGTLTVTDSTISSNTASGGIGGGIYALNAAVSVMDSSIVSNNGSAIYGSGNMSIVVDRTQMIGNTGSAVQKIGGSTTLRNSIVQNNGGGVGGSSSVLTIVRSIISDNHSGGVGNSGTTTITNSTIRNNTNDQFGGKGGGIGNTGTMYILNTSIINNTAFEAGGGIYNVLGHLYLTNSTVSGNFVINGTGNSPCPGGGIANIWNETNPGATVVLTNSTVASNCAQGKGGGICNQSRGTLTLRNSIIAQNTGTTGADVSGIVISEGNNLIGSTSGNSGWVATDLQNVNPQLAPLGNNGGATWTHALLPDSPAVNGGNNQLARNPSDNSLLVFDQRGKLFARFINGNVDIGAYEANYAAAPVAVGGRVLVNTFGRGVSKAYISITDTVGNVRYTQTNPFGYYRFIRGSD